MRGSFDNSCGVTLPLPGWTGVFSGVFASFELTAEFASPFKPGPGGETEEGLIEEEGIEAGGCFAASDFVLISAECTDDLPSCAFLSFHQKPAATSANI